MLFFKIFFFANIKNKIEKNKKNEKYFFCVKKYSDLCNLNRKKKYKFAIKKSFLLLE